MNTEQMPPNWQPKAWPETVEYQGHTYTIVKGSWICETNYKNDLGGWATSENPFFMFAMWQQSQEGK